MQGQVLLTPEQAAERLGLGRTTVYALIGSAELESVKIGRSRRVPVDAVAAYVERLRQAQVWGRA
ncbi:helix-turn-helix domain-containing protein [Actinokineospora iranica]|uniref:DNA binding domain-containing protein, excisionase family n=1 Tax=Actinokineospora iranica TaxID=1271860 RepID=A0A1G6SN86_9PSEU|nr:helix-turn-helix domain-containing protein [Actinokineospora iranica]SDD18308.1 DNA binding domain-containing protein, excisionase family [Actinokineospora iranica]